MDKERLIKFAERLRECIEQSGMSDKEVSRRIKVSPANLSRYLKGEHGAGRDAIAEMALLFKVNPAWLMGYDAEKYLDMPDIGFIKVPVLGNIAAGSPILVCEDYTEYECVSPNSGIDFCLRVKGDSMTGARLYDGDTVYLKKQNDVNHGEIAAILIDNEVTLKRVLKANGMVIFHPENPAYQDIIISAKQYSEYMILGKVKEFKSKVR